MVDYGLNDRVAIITGANNPWGIGATTALAFAREGATASLTMRSADSFTSVQAFGKQTGSYAL